MIRTFLLLGAVGCTWGSPPPPPPETAAESTTASSAIDLDDPQACAACHGAVVAEWQGSQHARAHHDYDPIYGAMRSFRMEKQGAQVAEKCVACHNPRDTADPDSAAGRTGVSCATCHNLEGVATSDEATGVAALTWAEPGVVRGPHGATGAAAPHGIGPAAPWLTDGTTLCLACHAAAENPKGVATCTTGSEHGELQGAGSCTSCHMPEVQGASGVVSTRETHRSHAFLGPHRLWSDDPSPASRAATIDGSLRGEALEVSLTNASGHGLPSGFPGRMVIVKAVALDAGGAEVWTNFTDDPVQQDPQAVLFKVYVDDEGKPVMPPFASAIAKDTRLRADETRTLRWSGLPADATKVRVTLLFRMLPPPAIAALGLGDTPYATPRPLLSAEIAR